MRSLQYILNRSVWMLSATAISLVMVSLMLVMYITWRYVHQFEPVQQHLQYLTSVGSVGFGVRTHLVAMLESEAGYLDPNKLSALQEQLHELENSTAHLEDSTPQLVHYSMRQFLEFDGTNEKTLERISTTLRGALNQELVAHHNMVEELHVEATKVRNVATNLAFGLLVVSLILWTLFRQRIVTPLNKLTDQMSYLSRRDYSELALEDVDPVLVPMFEKYNRMAKRLSKLEQAQLQREETLTEEVRNATYMLLKQQHRLAQSERLGAVGEMAAGIAHELRNPLTSVQMALDNLCHDVGDPELVERIKLIAKETKRVTRQLNQLLAQARQRPESSVPVQVAEEMEMLVSLAVYQLNENISVHYDAPADLVCQLPRSRFHQALLNLVLNAGQILSDAGGKIIMRAQSTDDKLLVSVTDTGPGFTAELLEAGVQAFRSWRVGGTGLGLVMVRRFVNDLGGSLELTNVATGGACVTMTLPCGGSHG